MEFTTAKDHATSHADLDAPNNLITLGEPDVPKYRHESLPEKGDWIRVLQLYATRSRIECALTQIRHTDGNYQALSYVWGSQDTQYKAFVVDQSSGATIGFISLTTNLRNALHNLRDCADIADKVFWIDQICINQESTDEKNYQVAMMGQIYTHASRVIMYMGRGCEDHGLEEKGIKLIDRLYEHFSLNFEYFEDKSPENDDTGLDKSVLPITKLPSDLAAEDPLQFWGWKWLAEEVIFNEWGTRLWMVQEQQLNLNTMILRGERLLSWDSVAVICTLFFGRLIPVEAIHLVWSQKYGHARESAAPWEFPYAVFRSWKARRKLLKSGASKHDDLITNMRFYDALGCQDPRDRIYALLAISGDTTELEIVPDYNIERKTLFCDISIRDFVSKKDLSGLPYACYWDNSDLDHPSWAINTPRPLEKQAQLLPGTNTRTHPRTTTNIRFNNRIMIVQGRHVDTIRFGSAPNYINKSVSLGINDINRAAWFLDFLASGSKILLDTPRMSLESVRATCRCLALDPLWNPTPKNGRSQEQEIIYTLLCSYRRLYSRLQQFYDVLDSTANHDVQLTIRQLALLYDPGDVLGSHRTSNQTAEDEKSGSHFDNPPLNVGRSFGKTASGRIFNAMHEVQEGDAIMVLQGSPNRLWTLRPAGNSTYRVIGEIYVDGYMNGELYHDVDPDEVDYDICIV